MKFTEEVVFLASLTSHVPCKRLDNGVTLISSVPGLCSVLYWRPVLVFLWVQTLETLDFKVLLREMASFSNPTVPTSLTKNGNYVKPQFTF